jgi:hypothetical protein
MYSYFIFEAAILTIYFLFTPHSHPHIHHDTQEHENGHK